MVFFCLQDLGLVLELIEQFINIGNLATTGTFGWFFDFESLKARSDIDAQVLGCELYQWFLFRLHDVGQRSIAGFIQANALSSKCLSLFLSLETFILLPQVGRDDRRQFRLYGFQTTIDFTSHLERLVLNFDLGSKRCL